MGNSIATSIEGLQITPLKIIDTPGGAVMHAMKKSDSGFISFGEAYFSNINPGSIKGWKRHRQMTLNLVVPNGEVLFVIYDTRSQSESFGVYQQVVLSQENYCRLTVPPLLWLGFQGIARESSTILNIADKEHQLDEVDRKMLNEFNFDWEIDL